ncbi:hypothetical protein HPP92_020018 [Vanilla planifolia]|uniref:POX domain-containing protein n=1 Tax=Vanilla planifolia TaxID=51239 RepID=A0A835QA40_VANPL|nr:hypothetical protein HPP92_020018 [Vanilla planifolia]
MTGASMSQEIHHRNVYSLSEEFDRHEANQTQHKMQTLSSRRGKLRVRDFEPTTAESAVSVLAVAGVPIEIVEDRDAAAVYVSSCASNTISEMFNFSNTAELIDCHNPHGYHRLQQQLSPITSKWYAGDRLGMVQLNPGNITSLDEASGADSPTAIQLFFMNPQSASTASIVDGPQAQQCQRTFSASSLPPMGTLSDAVSTLHPHHPVYQSHAFLGTAYASIGDAAGLGVGHVIENQVLSLSLSSPLKQFELAKAEDQQRIRPEGLPFNVNSTHEQQEQHPNHHQPPHVPSHDRYGSHVIAGPNVHMSYSTMDTVNLLRTSKYAWAAQELLEEFCNLRTNKTGRNFPNPNPSHGGGAASTSTTVASSSSLKDFPHLSAADRFENQRKKSKLLSMLDEVDRRYNHYCEEMQMVVNSFDTVIGLGAAAPYTALAKKAMSRHFRCLKDAMAAQLKRTCELLGEKDAGIVSGLTRRHAEASANRSEPSATESFPTNGNDGSRRLAAAAWPSRPLSQHTQGLAI